MNLFTKFIFLLVITFTKYMFFNDHIHNIKMFIGDCIHQIHTNFSDCIHQYISNSIHGYSNKIMEACGKLKTLVKYLIGEINYDSNKCRSLLATTKVL